MMAGLGAPAIMLAAAPKVTLGMLLLLLAWSVVPLYAGVRVITDVRYGLRWWSASRAGARHARRLGRLENQTIFQERANPRRPTGVTQGGIHHRAS
ncbi:hypothetical protein FAF44_02745 [Nonomuraea sp. MG754425]|uniref:hypothetical protein n=1 Tax=Nonomuraea sp. MG754425 TaxID=2570319 RepID=UPI001F29189C|nr:hypothetical protein [Nonomuraea sp. MG754425]MCF6467332.1 hypothetical protein [Nonomuraea sp. MG754425]